MDYEVTLHTCIRRTETFRVDVENADHAKEAAYEAFWAEEPSVRVTESNRDVEDCSDPVPLPSPV